MSVETGKNVIGISPLVQDPTDPTKSAQTALGRDVQAAAADKPAYYFNSAGHYITLTSSDHLLPGSGDCTDLFVVKAKKDLQQIFSRMFSAAALHEVSINCAGNGALRYRLIDSVDSATYFTTQIIDNTVAAYAFTRTDTGSGNMGLSCYINGDLKETISVVKRSPTGTVTLPTIGYTSQSMVDATMYRYLKFNYALSAAKIRKYSMGAKLDFDDVGGSMTELLVTGTPDFGDATKWGYNSGSGSGATLSTGEWVYKTGVTMVGGKRYRVSATFTGTATVTFRVGSSTPQQSILLTSGVAVEFVLNSGLSTYSPTLLIGGTGDATFSAVSLIQLGAVLDLEPESMTPTVWHDESGNGLDGVVTGATLVDTPHFAQTDYGRAAVIQELMDSNASTPGYYCNGVDASITFTVPTPLGNGAGANSDGPFSILMVGSGNLMFGGVGTSFN
jgi:hypothetical protein